jgi:hypothetical protein
MVTTTEVVRCSGTRADGRRCTVLVDGRGSADRHYCQHPDCRKSFQREYAQRPEAKRLNLRRVHRRRYGREHRCEACTSS